MDEYIDISAQVDYFIQSHFQLLLFFIIHEIYSGVI